MSKYRHPWNVIAWAVALYICTLGGVAVAQSTEVSLGALTTRMHNVAGEVVLLSERVLEVRGFVYDGEAPAVYFWADTNAVPSTSGFRMNDGSPNNGCGVTPLPLEADGSVTYRVEFPDGTTIYDLLGGSISLWCESFSVSFGEVTVPTSLSNIPDTASGPNLECSANVVETPIAAPSAAPIPAPTVVPVTPPSSVTVPAPTATTETPATEAPAASPTAVTEPAPTATSDSPVVSPVAAPTTTTVDVPYLLGNLTTRAHNVTGMVYIISDHIIEIRGFTYDGEGPAAYFYIDTAAEPTVNGLSLLDSEGGSAPSCGMTPLVAADGTDIYRAEFPNGTSIQDFLGGSFSVWCTVAAANFGEIVVPSTLPESVSAFDDLSLLVCDTPKSEETESFFIGNLTTRAHNVTGSVYLISDRIIEIRDFTYDGEGPAAHFYMDTATEPTANGLSLLDSVGGSAPSCGLTPLLAADGSGAYRAEFPNGTSVQDFLGGSFSVWCTAATANFGEVVIPSTLPESLSAVDDSSLLICSTPMLEETGSYFIGNLTTRAHNVSGSVFAISDRIIEIKGFTYDGEGPAAYFYMDTAAVPTANGLSLLDSEGGTASSCGMAPLLAADGTDVYRAEFPSGTSIQDFLGGSFSIWCETAAANFGEVEIPSTLPASVSAVDDTSLLICASETDIPSFVATPVGYNCEPLTETFQVRWLVEGEYISVELIGIIDEEDYMSFGVSGKADATFMIDGDVVVADSFEGTYRARDFYMSSRSQCSNATGVCPDTDGDGAVDDVNATSISGDRDQGVTVIRYQKSLVPSDAFGIDIPISAGAGDVTFINWALGPLNPETGNPQFHLSYPKSNVSIEFGRDVVDNCAPIISGTTATEAPLMTSFEIPMIQDVTELVATIGPSGGDRGYKGITGQISWGIAWYINDLLAPVIEMKRGTTYTITAYGGNDASNGAEYHPFYITTSPFGGYQQINATERAKETVYAGIENIVYGDGGSVLSYTSPFIAPICLYVTTDATDEVVLTGTYPEYFATLDTSCKDDAEIVDNGATFTFTPNETTPDLLYYHCVTHRNLGWKIIIVDADDVSPVAAPTTSDGTYFGLSPLLATTTMIFFLYIQL